ncbi:MAG TPA: hypothetical protein VF173_01170 [Thermoanaerobaculia bacterium]|nr:hypothetical protein [Thermoanaerobaculia bacterium]
MKPTLAAVLTFLCLSSVGVAQQGRTGAEPGVLESHSGRLDLVNQGQAVVIKLAGPAGKDAVWFRVETSSPAPLPSTLKAVRADLFYWEGQVLLLAANERKAFYFSIPGFKPGRVMPPPGGGPPVRSTPDLDSLLAGYDLTRIDTVTGITSAQGPRALAVIEGRSPSPRTKQITPFTPPPDPPHGGLGTCGASCSTTCGDGSFCTVTCANPRCASCSCPASCICS